MPRFPLTEDQISDLVKHLVATDRLAPGGPATSPTLSKMAERVVQAAGRRLVTTSGFGCTSCHEIGGVKPVKAQLNARGPDLSGLSTRVRREWFDRFVRNPARMVPRMEMPSIKLAVKGVLDDHLDYQLDAVWQVLNQPGFKPPPSGAVRIVRRSGVAERQESSAVLTDVLHVGADVYVKPLLIGLPNRHNVLFDWEQIDWLAGGRVTWPISVPRENLVLGCTRKVLDDNQGRGKPIAVASGRASTGTGCPGAVCDRA